MSIDILKSTIKWLAFTALAAPLLFSVYFYPSHVAPQTFLFRLIVELMVVFYAALLLKDNSFFPKPSLLSVSVLFFVIVLITAGFLGEDPYHSFFSDFERHWGIATILHFAAFFFVLSAVFRSAEEWKKFFTVSVSVSALAALYGLYQFFFQDVGGRIYGSVGNPSFLAAYLLLNGFIAIWLAMRSAARNRILIFGALAAFDFSVALLTGTRAALIAFAAGAVVMFAAHLLFEEGGWAKKRRYFLTLGALTGLIFLGFVFRESAFMRSAGLGRVFEISLTQSTSQTRLLSWRAALGGVSERPWLGAGPDNFNLVFNKHFPAEFYDYETYETEFDRAHNIFLETAATAGALGLLAYLMIFASFLWTGFRNLRGDLGIFISFAAAYFAQGFFGIDVLTSFLPLLLLLAYANYPLNGIRFPSVGGAPVSFKGGDWAVLAAVFLVAGYAAWILNIKSAVADMALSDANAARQNISDPGFVPDLRLVRDEYQKAEQAVYGSDTARAGAVLFALDFYEAYGKNAPPEFQNDFLPYALDAAVANAKEHPLNYLYHFRMGRLYNIQYLLSRKENTEIERMVVEAERLAPDRLEVPLALAQLDLLKGNYDAAIERSKAGLEKNRHFLDFYHIAFLAYNFKGDENKAFDYITEGIDNGLAIKSAKEMLWLADQYKKRGMTKEADDWTDRVQKL